MPVAFHVNHTIGDMDELDRFPECSGWIFGNPFKILIHPDEFFLPGLIRFFFSHLVREVSISLYMVRGCFIYKEFGFQEIIFAKTVRRRFVYSCDGIENLLSDPLKTHFKKPFI